MGNTKLSNTYGFEKVVKGIPSQIDLYEKELQKDISGIKERSLYYSEMSVPGMIICILLCNIGAMAVLMPTLILECISTDVEGMVMYNVLIRICGLLLLLAGIHEISEMIFTKTISSCDKKVTKIAGFFKKQFETSLEKMSANQMIDLIANCKDMELPERDVLDDKLVNSVEALNSKNQLMNKLTGISRKVFPIVLYVLALFVLFKNKHVSAVDVVLAFGVMILFSRRLCLLLEYKVGKSVRTMMTIPMFLYGLILYFRSRENFKGMCILPYDLQLKVPAGVQPFVSSVFVICVLQVAVLALSVLFQDYYSEKKRLTAGIAKTGKEKKKRGKWYIYGYTALQIFLFAVYIIVFNMNREKWQDLSSVRSALFLGIIFGVIWRLVSPIWPETVAKTIREFWGVKYSIVASGFVFIIIATLFLLNGLVFNGYVLTAFITMIISSWIAFAAMVRFME